jgi:anti-sigma B factor antagonist
MKITTDHSNSDSAILHVEGRLDAETAGDFKHAIRELAGSGVKFITVDMAQVSFLDSSGLSALVAGIKILRPMKGRLNLAALRPQAKTALRLTLLDRVLPTFETLEEAVAHSQASRQGNLA